MRYFKTVNFFDSFGNISLAHSSCIHSQHLFLYFRYILLPLWHKLRFKAWISVTRHFDFNLSCTCPDFLIGIAVATVIVDFAPWSLLSYPRWLFISPCNIASNIGPKCLSRRPSYLQRFSDDTVRWSALRGSRPVCFLFLCHFVHSFSVLSFIVAHFPKIEKVCKLFFLTYTLYFTSSDSLSFYSVCPFTIPQKIVINQKFCYLVRYWNITSAIDDGLFQMYSFPPWKGHCRYPKQHHSSVDFKVLSWCWRRLPQAHPRNLRSHSRDLIGIFIITGICLMIYDMFLL